MKNLSVVKINDEYFIIDKDIKKIIGRADSLGEILKCIGKYTGNILEVEGFPGDFLYCTFMKEEE